MRSASALDQARNCPEVVEVAADARDLPAACAPWPAGARAFQGIEGGGATLASSCRGPAKRGPKG